MPMPWTRPVAALALGGIAAGYVAAVDPAHGGHYPVCPLRSITGWSCPLCGGLRSTHQLLTGHPAHAFKLNALYVTLVPLAAYAFVAWTLATVGRPVLPTLRVSRHANRVLIVVAIAFGVARNLPGFHAWSGLGV
jgi:hypothetical protein